MPAPSGRRIAFDLLKRMRIYYSSFRLKVAANFIRFARFGISHTDQHIRAHGARFWNRFAERLLWVFRSEDDWLRATDYGVRSARVIHMASGHRSASLRGHASALD